MYLSCFFSNFKGLLLHEQHQAIYLSLGIKLGLLAIDDDNDSIDSTDSIWSYGVSHCLVFRAACHRWSHELTPDVRKAWEQWAQRLNRRKLPGEFKEIPMELLQHNNIERNKTNVLKTNVMMSMTWEWEGIVAMLKNCIRQKPKSLDSITTQQFGHEKVTLGTQSYRKVQMSYLLHLAIFGRDFANVYRSEVVHESRRRVLLHIPSQARMKELFTMEEYCTTKFEVDMNDIKFIHTCCGKVNISEGMNNNNNILGYILEEKNHKWKILLEDHCVVYVNKIIYNEEQKRYIFPQGTNNSTVITNYWPIRLAVKINGGGFKMTLNRVAYKKQQRGRYQLMLDDNTS